MNEKTMKLSPEVVQVLRESCVSLNTLTPPARRLTKKVYSDFKKAVTVMGGKWVGKAGSFTFPLDCDFESMVVSAVRTGEVFNRQQTFQEFFTPPVLANRMAELLTAHFKRCPPKSDIVRVLEPSAGKGALVEAVLGMMDVAWGWVIYACEIQQRNLDCVLNDLRVHKIQGDFMHMDSIVYPTSRNDGCGYNAAVMNPPFAGKTWAKHVEHAADFLLESGVLISVVPANAQVSDVEIGRGKEVLITPVSFRFDDTNVKVAILTVGISAKTVSKIFPPAPSAPAPLPERVTMKSLDKCLAGLRNSTANIIHELDALEAMLHE